jgi:hypothetical protein
MTSRSMCNRRTHRSSGSGIIPQYLVLAQSELESESWIGWVRARLQLC